MNQHLDSNTRHALQVLGIPTDNDALEILVTGEDGRDSNGDRWAAVGPISVTDRRPCVWFLTYSIDTTYRTDIDVVEGGSEDVENGGALEELASHVATALEEADLDNGEITLEINYWAVALTGALAA